MSSVGAQRVGTLAFSQPVAMVDGGRCGSGSSDDDDGAGLLSLRRSDGGSCGSDCSDGDDGVRQLSLRRSQRRRFPRKRT